MKLNCTADERSRAILTIGVALLVPLLLSARHWSIRIRTLSGNYVSAQAGGGGALMADRSAGRDWETFTVIDLNAGELNDNDMVALCTFNGHFVSALNSGGDELNATAERPDRWETFILKRARSRDERKIADGDTLVFESISGYLISATGGGGAGLRVDRTAVGSWEKFVLDSLGPPARLKLSGPFTQPQMILATPIGQDHDGTKGPAIWNCSHPFLGDKPPHCYDGHNGTDFLLAGAFAAMNAGSIDVVAAAPGFVIQIADGNVDNCHVKFPPPPPNASPEDWIDCPGTTETAANFVVILQDDGRIAFYYHLRRESVTVRIGDRVGCGQALGKIGSSGISSVPHLHFSLASVPLDEKFPELGSGSLESPKINWLVDPYTPEVLWTHLSGQVPDNVCLSQPGAALRVPRHIGEPCAMPLQPCEPFLTCDQGTCRMVGLLPGASCDQNNTCALGLVCRNGQCVPIDPQDLGSSCNVADRRFCDFPAVCDNGVCHILDVPINMVCDENHRCGPGLECRNGKCHQIVTQAVENAVHEAVENPPCVTPCPPNGCPWGFHCDNGCCLTN